MPGVSFGKCELARERELGPRRTEASWCSGTAHCPPSSSSKGEAEPGAGPVVPREGVASLPSHQPVMVALPEHGRRKRKVLAA